MIVKFIFTSGQQEFHDVPEPLREVVEYVEPTKMNLTPSYRGQKPRPLDLSGRHVFYLRETWDYKFVYVESGYDKFNRNL